jgi:tether containing UBX domain for GLUT4
LEEEKRILSQLNAYKRCVLRIQFPNRYVLQSKFSPVEKIEDVSKHVRKYLMNPDMEFHLYVTPPKTVLEGSLNLLEARCVPNALLHFGVDQETEEDPLKPEIYEKLTSIWI